MANEAQYSREVVDSLLTRPKEWGPADGHVLLRSIPAVAADVTERLDKLNIFEKGARLLHREAKEGTQLEHIWNAFASTAEQMRFELAANIFDVPFESVDDAKEYMNLPPSAAFKAIDELVRTRFIEGLRSVLGSDSKFVNIADEIFNQTIWRGVDEGSNSQMIFFRLCEKAIRLRGQLVDQYMENSPMAKEKVNPIAKVEYLHFGAIADATNKFFITWHRDSFESSVATEQRQKLGFKNEFAVVLSGSDGQLQEVPWHEAYPEETGELRRLYECLADELGAALRDFEGDPDLRARHEMKINYYRAVASGWETSDINKWRNADALLPQQTLGASEPVHIHTIEIGYGKDAVQRVPEASLRYPDDAHKNINERAFTTRSRMLLMLQEFATREGFSSEVKDVLGLIQRSNFGARHVMGSGSNMTFRAAAQVLPNEEISRRRGGVDVSCDPEAMTKRFVSIREAFRQIFGREWKIQDEDIVSVLGDYVASHEFSHVVGINSTTDDRVDTSLRGPLVEEWKATAGGMILNEWMPYLKHTGDESMPPITLDDLRKSIENHIGIALRYITLRDNPHQQPYMRKSMMLMKVAEDVGIVNLEGENWTLDYADAKVLAFYAKLEEQYVDLVTIYDSGTTDDLNGFVSENLKPTRFLNAACSKLDALNGRTQMPSMEKLSHLT